MSEVVRGEKMRLTPVVDIRSSVEVATAEPFTVGFAVASMLVFTDGLRV